MYADNLWLTGNSVFLVLFVRSYVIIISNNSLTVSYMYNVAPAVFTLYR